MLSLSIYAAGVVIALAVMRDPWPARLTTALVWPLGPAAFVVVLSIMLVAAVFVWPVPILVVLALAAAAGFFLL